MGLFRLFRYKYLLKKRSKYATLAMSIALAHASFGSVRYRSLGNGMADISLSLEEDKNFKLDLHKLDEQKHFSLKGTWEKLDNNYVLRFKKVKPDLKSLFVSNTGYEYNNSIEDKKTVKIPSLANGIMIMGIYCERH